METLQWTMLVGLLAMLLYVLWHRMRASFGKGVPPPVAADWEGEGALWSSGVVDIHLRVERAGEVTLSVHMDNHDNAVHEGALEVASTRGAWRCQMAQNASLCAWRARVTARSGGCSARAEPHMRSGMSMPSMAMPLETVSLTKAVKPSRA